MVYAKNGEYREIGRGRKVKIGANVAGMAPAMGNTASGKTKNRFFDVKYQTAVSGGDTGASSGSRLQGMPAAGAGEDEGDGEAGKAEKAGVVSASRSEAEKIYEAAMSGKKNPIESMRQAPKVPYGHLAKDGVIVYNGVTFVCDEKTNSICLGDVSDAKNVLNIPLSGGGHLKVNRNSLGLLSRVVGMFSPEDLNLIMRAIAEDAKIQSVQEEIEDEEASVGNQLTEGGESARAAEEEETE